MFGSEMNNGTTPSLQTKSEKELFKKKTLKKMIVNGMKYFEVKFSQFYSDNKEKLLEKNGIETRIEDGVTVYYQKSFQGLDRPFESFFIEYDSTIESLKQFMFHCRKEYPRNIMAAILEYLFSFNISSVSAERSFSVARHIYTNYRHSLDDPTVEATLYVWPYSEVLSFNIMDLSDDILATLGSCYLREDIKVHYIRKFPDVHIII